VYEKGGEPWVERYVLSDSGFFLKFSFFGVEADVASISLKSYSRLSQLP
jgi:hypothetical protein